MKEIVIQVTIMVVGEQVSFPVQCKRKREGGGLSVMKRSGSGDSRGGDIRREASWERRYRCRRRLAVADGTRLTAHYLQEQRGRNRIVRGGEGNSTRVSQNAGFTCL